MARLVIELPDTVVKVLDKLAKRYHTTREQIARTLLLAAATEAALEDLRRAVDEVAKKAREMVSSRTGITK